MAEEFYNFDEALDQLNLREEELKRLVSEGEIRAFREGETMKLRRADVETLRGELMGGEVVDLGGPGEELIFEDDLDLQEAGMATEEISEMDTLLEEDVEDVGEVELEDEPVAARETSTRAVRRTAAVAVEEEAEEGMGMRIVAIATTAVLVLCVPVTIGVSQGTASGIAAAIAGLFGADLGE